MVHCLQWAFIEGGTSLHFETIVLLAFHLEQLTYYFLDFPGGSEGKVPVYNAGDQGSIPGSGRSPGEGNGNPLQYYCLENPMDRGAWWATVHGVAKSRARLSDFIVTFRFTYYYRTG